MNNCINHVINEDGNKSSIQMKGSLKTITTEEAALQFGLSARKIRDLCESHLIDCFKSDRKWHIDPDSLEIYLTSTHRTREIFLGDKRYAFGNISVDMDEVLKPVASALFGDIFDPCVYEFDSQYLVSNKGNVYSCKTGIMMRPSLRNGYPYVNLMKDGRCTPISIHRLVCYFFNHNRYCKRIVHHIDGVPTNNYANNLLWVTSNQHKQLHQLLNTDTAAYRHMVTQIKRENRWRS